jgi:MEKHLA domain
VTPHPPLPEPFLAALVRDYARLLGAPLVVPELSSAAQYAWLYAEAPFCVLAHDATDDPRFVFANRMAQRCFEAGWDQLVGMPSRLSAGPADRAERERLLRGVQRDGFVRGYRGLRVARSGRQFWIEDVTVWNVYDLAGARIGQAATYLRTSPA